MSWEFYLIGGVGLLVSPFAVFMYAKIASYAWRLGAYNFRRDQQKGKFDGT